MIKFYSNKLPEAKYLKFLKQYPNHFDKHHLHNELPVVYSDTEKHISPCEMLTLFFKSRLIKK